MLTINSKNILTILGIYNSNFFGEKELLDCQNTILSIS